MRGGQESSIIGHDGACALFGRPSRRIRPAPRNPHSRGALGTWHLALGTWHLALGTWHLALGTWHLALGTWHLALGTCRSATLTPPAFPLRAASTPRP